MKFAKKAGSLILSLVLCFSAVPALRANAAQVNPVSVTVQSAGGSMNLTDVGNIDWVHVTGNGNNRKDIATPIIEVEKLNANEAMTTLTDSPVAYSWTDGTPDVSATDNRQGGVYNWQNGVDGTTGVPITEDTGYSIKIPAESYPRVLTFVSGVWNSDAEISLFVNGDTTPIYTNAELTAGSSVVNKKYTINIRSGNSVEIICKFVKKSHNYGNLNLSAVSLGKIEVDDNTHDYKVDLADLIMRAESYDTEGIDDFFVNQLNAELEYSKEVIADALSTNESYYEAMKYLNAAYDGVKANTGNRKYTFNTASGLTSSFGWEGDKDAPIAYVDGSYKLRDRDGLMVTFGVWEIPGKIAWYNKEGYLPCFVSEYGKDDLEHVVESFSDLVVIGGNRFEIAYSRMTTTNNSSTVQKLPSVSDELIPLNADAKTAINIQPGQTIVRDYAIGADRFGGSYNYPTDSEIAAEGDWDTHYNHMKDYWNNRLAPLAEITDLPDETLIDAYKAGYIYTLLIADNYELHVGENGYDRVFDHDVIGMLATLLTIGDYTNAQQYAVHILDNVQYPDARWKYSWPFAVYLQRTGDSAYIESMFNTIKDNTHYIEAERTGSGGIMKNTEAIDSNGSWLIDNWAALAGLTTYKYICDYMYVEKGDAKYQTESQWAQTQYDELLLATETAQKTMRDTYDYPYLSIDMKVPTEQSVRSDARDANWASMFLFGRWAWDAYLFGADQTGSEMLELIDDTYTHGFDRRRSISDTIYNFGGYPHGYFSSAYNAGYGSSALRGEKYRDSGIKAYQFMIAEAMSGPFGWWEGVDYPKESSPWDIDHASGGGGSCQHMWGQATATKVLFDALIAPKEDGSAIIGRGIPNEWISDGEKIAMKDYTVSAGNKVSFDITTSGKTVTLNLSGNSSTPVSFELIAFKDNIKGAGGLNFDNKTGIVTVPAGTNKVTVTLENDTAEIIENNEAKDNLLTLVTNTNEVEKDIYVTNLVEDLQNAVNEANDLLANSSTTTQQLNDAAKKVEDALNALVPLSVGETGLEYTGTYKNKYTFGKDNDEVRRYQTFKTTDKAGKVGGIDLNIHKMSTGTYGDVIVSIYTLQADNKTIDTLVGETRIDADKVKSGKTDTVRFDDLVLEPDTYYAIMFGQDRTNVVGSACYAVSVFAENITDLYFIKDKGDGTYQDETFLGNAFMSITYELFNKKELEQTFEDALTVTDSGYTNSSWVNFETSIENAKSVLNNANSTKEECENAKKAIEDAKVALVKGADFTELAKLVNTSDNLVEKDYTAESFAELKKALSDAKTVLANVNATQKQVDDAVKLLEDAVIALVKKAPTDFTELENLVNTSEKLAENDYTTESFAELKKALSDAKTVLANTNATQKQVDDAVKLLEDAVDNLVRIDVSLDFDALKNAINEAKAVTEKSGDYKPSTIKGLAEKLSEARELLTKTNVTQQEIDLMSESLSELAQKAVLKEDNSKLVQQIAIAEEVKAKDYTEKSYNALKTALEKAKLVAANGDATAKEISDAEANLANAVKNLVKTSSNTGNSNNNNGANSNNSGAKTGDSTNVMLYVGIMAAAVLAIVVLLVVIKKKKLGQHFSNK